MSVIYAPYLNEFYFAQRNQGSYFIQNYKKQTKLDHLKKLTRIKVSNENNPLNSICTYCFGYDEKIYTRMSKIEARLRKDFEEARLLGTAAVELAWVAAGRAEGMLVPAARIWDVAAGILLVREAGGKVTDFKGKEWNMTSKSMLATNRVIHGKILKIINQR